MSKTITVNLRNPNGSPMSDLLKAINTDMEHNGYAARIADYLHIADSLSRQEKLFGAVLHYDTGSKLLEVEYTAMHPLEFTLRHTALTFAYHALLSEDVMRLALDFTQAQPIVNDDDADPIMVYLDFDEHTPEDVFAALYGLYSLNLFAVNEDGLHGWDDAEAFEEALGRHADMHHLHHLMTRLDYDDTFTVAQVRERMMDLQFYPKLSDLGWPKWSRIAVVTAVSMLANEVVL